MRYWLWSTKGTCIETCVLTDQAVQYAVLEKCGQRGFSDFSFWLAVFVPPQAPVLCYPLAPNVMNINVSGNRMFNSIVFEDFHRTGYYCTMQREFTVYTRLVEHLAPGVEYPVTWGNSQATSVGCPQESSTLDPGAWEDSEEHQGCQTGYGSGIFVNGCCNCHRHLHRLDLNVADMAG